LAIIFGPGKLDCRNRRIPDFADREQSSAGATS
jgi:hypothetical protein